MTESEYAMVADLIRIQSARSLLRGLDTDDAPAELVSAMASLSKVEAAMMTKVYGLVR